MCQRLFDLGAQILINRSTFNLLSIYIINFASYSIIGFVKWICKKFRTVETIKSLYFAKVRSHLEYAFVYFVWIPFSYTFFLSMAEVVKEQFARLDP